MADQVYMVYYQLMQESVNFTIETDPDRKEAIRQRIIALWRLFKLLLHRLICHDANTTRHLDLF